MAHTALQMQSFGTPGEECAGCLRPFARGEQMNGMEYEGGDSAGWHCDDCVSIWETQGEQHLPRWEEA